MATDIAALQTTLTNVQAAINAILTGGQIVEYNGRRVAMADLEQLQKLEINLERRISRLTNGGMKVRRGTPL